jgi:hypothetical protein
MTKLVRNDRMIRRAGLGKNPENGIRRATNSRIRRAGLGKSPENGIRRATNSPIRRAENGKNPENAMRRATNPRIRRAGCGKNRKYGIRRATNARIRRADRGKIRQKWGVCAMRATNLSLPPSAFPRCRRRATGRAGGPLLDRPGPGGGCLAVRRPKRGRRRRRRIPDRGEWPG